jgi:hypothetical protein
MNIQGSNSNQMQMQFASLLLLVLLGIQLHSSHGWVATQGRQRLQPVNLAKKRSIVNRQKRNEVSPPAAADDSSSVIPAVNNEDYRFKIMKSKEEKNDEIIPTQLLIDSLESKKGLTTLLEDDIKELSQKSLKIDSINSSSSSNSPVGGIMNTVKDAVSIVLLVDFFVILFFLGWFILAAVLKDSNPYFLERFQDLFNPVVQPAIGILMAGSIASGLLGDRKKEN